MEGRSSELKNGYKVSSKVDSEEHEMVFEQDRDPSNFSRAVIKGTQRSR